MQAEQKATLRAVSTGKVSMIVSASLRPMIASVFLLCQFGRKFSYDLDDCAVVEWPP